LSAGELLRKERLDPLSDQGKLIDSYLKEGRLVPVEVSLGLLKKEIFHLSKQRYLIDGFPRNPSQAKVLGGCLQDQCLELDAVVELAVPDYILDQRMIDRGRPEEQDPKVRKTRIEEFKKETAPVSEYYRGIGTVILVDGVGTPAEVTRRVMEATRLRKWYHRFMW
jgi:adenylate kinase family enzyme